MYINTWVTDRKRNEKFADGKLINPNAIDYYYNLKNPVFEKGDFRVFSTYNSHLYFYKNISINELVGLNIEHIEALIKDERPTSEQKGFLFDRAKEQIEKHKELIIPSFLG